MNKYRRQKLCFLLRAKGPSVSLLPGKCSLCSLDFDQPAGFRMLFAGGLLQDAGVFVDVAKVLSDLNQPDFFVSGKVGADHLRAAAFAIVALPVPAVEGEADALLCLREVGFQKPRG